MEPQKFCLRWDGFQDSVISVFDQLRSGGELLDVTLCCDGQRVRAHRMMLSACSPYFRDLLKSTPCQQMVIFLKDTSSQDLNAIIEFMYRGCVNVAQSQLASFIKTAETLQIRGLSGEDDKASDPALTTPSRPAPEPRPQPPPRHFAPPLKRRRVSDSGDVPLPPAPAPAPSWPRPAASPARRPETPVLLSSSSNQSAPSPGPAASPGPPAGGLAAAERVPGTDRSDGPPLPPAARHVPPSPSRSLSSSSTAAASAPAAASGTAAASAMAPASGADSPSSAADAGGGGIKVEKVDLSDGEEGGESSLDATLGQLAEYEGGYEGMAGAAAPPAALGSTHGVSFPGHQFGAMQPLPGPSQQNIPGTMDDPGTPGWGFSCQICGRVYRRSNALAAHKRTHEGVTICSICGAQISTVHNLRHHLRMVHRLSTAEAKQHTAAVSGRRGRLPSHAV